MMCEAVYVRVGTVIVWGGPFQVLLSAAILRHLFSGEHEALWM